MDYHDLEPDIDIPYALVWRWLNLSVHRYGSSPTGQALVVMTIVLLCDIGYYPTVTELADITGLPKSTVSRYVSFEMSAGMLEEVIDSEDRRRRMLRPSEKAAAEREWHRNHVRNIYRDLVEWHPGKVSYPVDDGMYERLIAHLKSVTASAPERNRNYKP